MNHPIVKPKRIVTHNRFLLDNFVPISRKSAEDHVRTIQRICLGPQGGLYCGYDVNMLICQHPFDGRLRTITCPACGEKSVIQFPLIITREGVM